MSKIVDVDYAQIQNTISALESEIKKLDALFQRQDGNFALLQDATVWYSPAREECLNKYNELSKKYVEIINNLNNYKGFLSSACEAYKKYDSTIEKAADLLSN